MRTRSIRPLLWLAPLAMLTLFVPPADAGSLCSGAPSAEALTGLEPAVAAANTCTVSIDCGFGFFVSCGSANNQCNTQNDCVVCDGVTQGCCSDLCADLCHAAADQCRDQCGGFGACLFFCNNREQRCLDNC